MQTLEATFRVVTPMFLSGADQSRAELRVPSIKGALRFWWRARAYQNDSGNLKKIRQKESELFGSADTNAGQAKVLIHLAEENIKSKSQNKWEPYEWQAYIGYGLIKSVQSQTSREFISERSAFTLRFILNKNLNETDKASISDALKVFGLLGGLGGRSRKGWGSITLIRLAGSDSNWEEPVDAKALKSILETLKLKTVGEDPLPQFTAFSKEALIVVGPVKNTAEEAHCYLADKYKDAVRATQPKPSREQFGLPRKQNMNRRASPLFLHIHGFPDEKAVSVAAFLPAQFLPDQPNLPGNGDDIKSFLAGIQEVAR